LCWNKEVLTADWNKEVLTEDWNKEVLTEGWNKEVLTEDWKGSVIVPVYRKGDKTELSNYRELPNPSTTYKILSNILLSRLTPYAGEIIRDHQCGFRSKISTTDHIL
jgi:hypothetical protein